MLTKLVIVSGTVYERSGDRSHHAIVAYTKASGEVFNAKNGDICTSFASQDGSSGLYKPLTDRQIPGGGLPNRAYEDTEITAF